MLYRAARVAGQFLGRLDGNPITPLEAWKLHVASEYGIDPATIEVVEQETDPRVGVLIDPPAPPPDPEMVELAQLYALLDKLDADVTAAEVKTLVLRYFRRLRRQGRLR